MKSLLTLSLLALLSLGIDACGGTGRSTTSVSRASAAATTASNGASAPKYTKADRDKDNDGPPGDETNNNGALYYGRAASASDERAIATLVERYYRAALAGDGAKACSLLYSTLAEAVPEDYGQSPPGPAYLAGKTCPAVMVQLFKHFHPQLTAELPLLKVTRVRLEQHHGWAILAFGTMPGRQISVAREGHVWKIQELLDTELP